VRGDRGSCRMAGRRIEEVGLPRGAQIGAIVRGLAPRDHDGLALGDKRGDAAPEVIIAHHDTVIQPGDRVIVFMPSRKQVREVEKLFQVSATFF
jgi:trk system potassium uptake protein TrkA